MRRRIIGFGIFALMLYLAFFRSPSTAMAESTVPAQPVIKQISPNNAQPGDEVTITGTGFGDGTQAGKFVAFRVQNLVPRDVAEIVSWTDKEIKVIVPQFTQPYHYPWDVFLGWGEGMNWTFSNDMPFTPQQPTAPEMVMTGFIGAWQWLTPEIINAGTVTITMDLNGHTWAELDGGQMTFRKDDGRILKIQNVWTHTGGNIYQWVQYIVDHTDSFWIDTNVEMDVTGFGPWQPNELKNGYNQTEDSTFLEITIGGPDYRDFGQDGALWNWTLNVQPQWAVDQYPWIGNMHLSVDTNCNGYGTNHGGNFAWSGVYPYPNQQFGNGVYPQWIEEPLTDVTVSISAAGWTVDVPSKGPRCWDSFVYLVFVSQQ